MADPTALYSHQGQEPQPLPHVISWDGGCGMVYRTDVNSFTDEELTKAGYTGPYEVPSIDIDYQRLKWDSETLNYIVENISDEELWSRIRSERNRLLAECDWILGCDVPNNKDINLKEWTLYRRKLRDLPETNSNPKELVWPLKPNETEILSFNPPIMEDTLKERVEKLEFDINRILNKFSIIQNYEDRIKNLENNQK